MSAKLLLVIAAVLCIGIQAAEFCGTSSPFSYTVSANSGLNMFYWTESVPSLTLNCFSAMSSNVAASALKFKIGCVDAGGQWTLLGDVENQNFNGPSRFTCPATPSSYYVLVYNPTASSISFQSYANATGGPSVMVPRFFGLPVQQPLTLAAAKPKAAATGSNFSYCQPTPWSTWQSAGVSWFIRWNTMGTSFDLTCFTASTGTDVSVFAEAFVACSESMTAGKYTMLGKLHGLGGARAAGTFKCPVNGYFFVILNTMVSTTWKYGGSASVNSGPSLAGELFHA